VALADMVWTETSVHNVVSEFLRAERDSRFNFHPPWLGLIDNPSLNDPLQNHQRLRLLYIVRGMFMVEIPPDTRWYEVQSLTEDQLGELYVSARHTERWDQAGNKLDQVAKAVQVPLKSAPDTWGRIILWGHDRKGPFSIMEGNHRMLAYAQAKPRPPLKAPVYVGLSPSYCFWHHSDPPLSLGQGLYRSQGPSLFAQDNWLHVSG
jgi:hypothetical protein